MISYAQNAEDVVLARALPGPTGFYVDVGAGHPDIASVTKHFYDRGWHGLNIEPRSSAIALLEAERPRDINLGIAVGAYNGEIELHVVEMDPDMSTTDDVDVDLLRDRGFEMSVEVVPVRTLDSILEEHAVETIDFLKIDVEGSEAAVLQGVDLQRWQPRVVVVESVKPWSHDRNDDTWRSRLELQGYREACFDGLNLFFAREDDHAIADALVPASVLDDFEPAASVAIREELDRVRAYNAKLEAELAAHREAQEEVTNYVRTLEAQLGPSSAIAPVIELGNAYAPRRSSRSLPPPRAARLAIIGTPRTGNTWVRRVLADALDAEEVAVHHPADIAWEDLHDRSVIQLHWPRSKMLQQMLRDHGFVVLSAARHPLDVLLSILMFSRRGQSTRDWLHGACGNEDHLSAAGFGDPAFLEWAESPRAQLLLSLTPSWWSTPTTQRVRYEDLSAEPRAEFARLLDQCELTPSKDLNASLADNSPSRIHAMSGGVHVWRAAPGAWRETLTLEQVDRLIEVHRDTFVSLGYDPDDRSRAER